jgi:hypothetical protein
MILMKGQNTAGVPAPNWRRIGAFTSVVPLLLSLFGLGFLSTSPAQAKADNFLGIIAKPETEHFVAVNGNDDGPGTASQPWATLNHAAEQAKAGDTIVVHGGHYALNAQVRPRNSGRAHAWISYVGYPGETPVLDAHRIPRSSLLEGPLDNGAFQIEHISYIRVINLTITNSHDAGFTVRDSSHIDLINDRTSGTFSSGIAVWDTQHNGKATRHIRILGNTITRANTWQLAPPGMPKRGEPPHEALSIGGAVDFEVAYNRVYGSDKEGIVVKETSRRGTVHHNLVYSLPRQGIYVGAWFGDLAEIAVFSNVIYDCWGAGIVLGVEDGGSVRNIFIHNNLILDNDGSGLLFSRWGKDNPRRDVQIESNVFYHNGYGPPAAGQAYYWITGGLYLYSADIADITIKNNIFSQNRGFQIGYSELFLKGGATWRMAARQKNIQITHNLIDGSNTINSPLRSGGNAPDRVLIYALNGMRAIYGSPMFKNPADQNFIPDRASPAGKSGAWVGAYAPGSLSRFWWKYDFPPKLGPSFRSLDLP